MRWLIAMLMALSFTFAGAIGIHAEASAAEHDVQQARSQQADAHCHTAGDMCCAHAISCCVVLNKVSARMLLQAISHVEYIDAGAQLFALPVPRPPPKSIAHSF